ncbi:hypothetical protein NIES4071_07840 [Calothrix sp. NIES-4071]|nr:hypothetical protein NIES4071_07840 [Calothrix sp. NIES-4071]BAZ55126.1 hypothetical protein NIES4105_07800 [Calothrix sp. NIES-4105]
MNIEVPGTKPKSFSSTQISFFISINSFFLRRKQKYKDCSDNHFAKWTEQNSLSPNTQILYFLKSGIDLER